MRGPWSPCFFFNRDKILSKMAETKAKASKPAAKSTLSPEDIKARKAAMKEPSAEEALKNENEKLLKQLEEMKKKAEEQPEVKQVEAAPATGVDAQLLSTLQAQVKLLSDQVMMQQSSIANGRPTYRPVPSEDFQEEGVTFTARTVFYLIGSYLDHKGVEVIPPYKLIKLQYASSDRRKEGHEETIVNTCAFTTHLKAEIEYLRDHPLCGIDFHENINQTMRADSIYVEFRVKAANQVIAMTDENVINNCHKKGVQGVNSTGVKELRRMLTGVYAEEYISAAKELQSDLDKRRMLGQPTS